MAGRVTLACPRCGAGVRFMFDDEWQGEGAMGAMVSLLDDVEQECDCDLTAAELDTLTDEALATELDEEDE